VNKHSVPRSGNSRERYRTHQPVANQTSDRERIGTVASDDWLRIRGDSDRHFGMSPGYDGVGGGVWMKGRVSVQIIAYDTRQIIMYAR
jgi:hypothetical protein